MRHEAGRSCSSASTLTCCKRSRGRRLLAGSELPLADVLKARIEPDPNPVPELSLPDVDLSRYDELLGDTSELHALAEVNSWASRVAAWSTACCGGALRQRA